MLNPGDEVLLGDYIARCDSKTVRFGRVLNLAFTNKYGTKYYHCEWIGFNFDTKQVELIKGKALEANIRKQDHGMFYKLGL